MLKKLGRIFCANVPRVGLSFGYVCPWGGFVSGVRLSLRWVCLGVGLSLGCVCPWGVFVPGLGLSLVYVCLGVGLSGVGLSGVCLSGVCLLTFFAFFVGGLKYDL